MLKALLWKEWQEQRWRMGLGCLWLLGLSFIGLKTRILPDIAILGLIWVPSMIILPLLTGMGVLAEERSERTLNFLLVQPISRWRIITSKLVMGLMACLGPILICGLLICMAIGGRELPTSVLMRAFIILAGFCTLIFLWQTLAGLKSRKEETYATMGIIVLGFWMVCGLVVDDYHIDHRIGPWTWWINPFAIIEVLDAWSYRTAQELGILFGIQGVILLGLIGIILFRFNRLREKRS